MNDRAYHYYTPSRHKVVHRSLADINRNNDKFNIFKASHKACLYYANKINDYVMGLNLDEEQRRLALWTEFSVPGMTDIVHSYGFNTKSMNIGLIITSNVSRFMQRAKTKANKYSRASDAQRLVANAITASVMATPLKNVDDSTVPSNNNQISGRTLLKVLGIPQGSKYHLKKCGEMRLAAKEGVYDFLGHRKKWKKLKEGVLAELRYDWIPNCNYTRDIPSKNDTVFV